MPVGYFAFCRSGCSSTVTAGFSDSHHDGVLRPRPNESRDVEREWRTDAVVSSGLRSVHPHRRNSMGSADAQHNGFVPPRFGNLDSPAIPACPREVMTKPRGRLSETLRLPCPGYLDTIRKGRVRIGEPALLHARVAGIEPELPRAVEIDTTARLRFGAGCQHRCKQQGDQRISKCHHTNVTRRLACHQ